MPYNPDADDDSYIGVGDVLGLLPLYGQQFGIDSSITCDYDGSSLEEWLGDLWGGVIVLDSVLVQWYVEDSALVYLPGCPDPIMDYVSYERAGMLTDFYEYNSNTIRLGSIVAGYLIETALYWDGLNGTYQARVISLEVRNTDLSDVLGSSDAYTPNEIIPINGEMTEEGISFDTWSGFLSSASYCRILPYWHYAE